MDYKELYNLEDRKKPQDAPTVDLPNTDDIIALSRSGLPALIKRAIELASTSTKVNEVMSVISELADRAYGKPSQSMDIKSTVDINHKTSDTDLAIIEFYKSYYTNKEPKECQDKPQLQ